MTKLAIIHLSDIHVHCENDPCFANSKEIAKSCFQSARDADACLLAITGDIAFSGTKEQYKAALNQLIKPLVTALGSETSRPVYVALVPGNHDCILIPPDEVRETIIETIVTNPSKAESQQIIDVCTKPQSDFFNFSDEVLHPKASIVSKLFWQQDFEVNGKRVRVSSLNAAWMSRLPESQGQLVYPIGMFEAHLSEQACVHLALIHHPFNWYSQPAYQQLRKRLRLSCTAVLSGHEHQGNIGKIEEQLSGTSLFFEAAALQPHEKNVEGGFSIHVFDFEKKEVSSQTFILSGKDVQINGESVVHTWSDDGLIHGALDITKAFSDSLNDAGGNFTHAAKERLLLEDLFVWPDVRVWEGNEASKQRVHSTKELASRLENGEHLIVYGDDKAGKTTLLLWYFRELISRGYFPVLLAASELNIKTNGDPEKRISTAISVQYKNPGAAQHFAKDRKVLLIDDIDRIKSGLNTLPLLLDYAERHFSGVCLTAASGFEVTNLASKDAASSLTPFKSFDLMRFGLKLRHQLIKKWCSLSGASTKSELDKQVDEVESIVNSVIGKRLVPEHPIYLLILLQSCEQHRHGEIQNSGLSFYYQYLITKSLGEVGVKPIELDEHFNYLSILAWRFREKGVKELDKTELSLVNQEFSTRFVSVDLLGRLNLLTKAHILSIHGDCYSFAYPYIYYFFIGRHLSKNLDDPQIRSWVEESCKKLYIRDRAHAIMFLTHHVESKWVIQLICDVLGECFSDTIPMELNKEETTRLNQLVEKSTLLTVVHPDVENNQVAAREYTDSLEDQDSEEEPNEYELLNVAAKWNLLHKTAEILGLILKNYYGSLERDTKQKMIREVFNGPLRALRLWVDEVASDLPAVVNDLKQSELAQFEKLTAEEAEHRVKRNLFNLMGWVASGVIASAGNFVASEKLREDISQVVNDNTTNAYRLIEAASRLLKPGPVNTNMVKKLAKDLEENPYAFAILQTLGFYHMYLFHTDEPQKQSLSHALKISFSTAKTIEAKKQARTLN